jgi:hypothetical protein
MTKPSTARVHVEVESPRYRVLRELDGHKPGEIVESRGWPWGRAKKLIDQRYIEPVPAKE